MAIFITSDTHFFHKNILKYQADERPFETIEEMNEAIVQRWNSEVGPEDTVYHLGDVAFANPMKALPLLKRLNGKIHLIEGNHDKGLLRNSELRACFESVASYREIKHDGVKIILCHYPIYSWNMIHHGALHFYGHTHGAIPHVWEGYSMDVGLDTNMCFPYNLSELVSYLADLRQIKGIEKTDPRDREEREHG